MEDIIKKIKKLKDVQPGAEYSQRSKLAILAAPISPKTNSAFKAMESVVEILRKLKQIRPDAEYSRISKLAILNNPLLLQKRLVFNWQMAFTMAGLCLVLISGALIKNSRPTAPHLNTQALETEIKNLDINIQLAKIEYSQNIDEAVSLALKEITEKQTDHLNPIILKSEQNELNSESSDNKEIDGLLNQILL